LIDEVSGSNFIWHTDCFMIVQLIFELERICFGL